MKLTACIWISCCITTSGGCPGERCWNTLLRVWNVWKHSWKARASPILNWYVQIDWKNFLWWIWQVILMHKSLQGKWRTALMMLEDVLVFESKMMVFARDVHSPSSPPLESTKLTTINCEYLQQAITTMLTAFGEWFSAIRIEKTKNTLTFPVKLLNINPSHWTCHRSQQQIMLILKLNLLT